MRFGHFLDSPWGFTPTSVEKARSNWLFSRLSLMSSAASWPLLTVQAFIPAGTTMPSADSSRLVRTNHSILSLATKTDTRPPEVSSTAFSARPPDLQPAPLMDTDFANPCSLVRHGMPRIWFFVHRPTPLLHAAFRPHLTMTPLRFAMTSPPSGCQRDLHPQAVRAHARGTYSSADL